MNFKPIAVAALSLLTVAACSGTRVNNSAGRATVYDDPGTSVRVQGVGVESLDLDRMTDKMMRDMLE